MLARIVLALFVLLPNNCQAQISGIKTSENYTHSTVLDNDGSYILFWKFNDTHITFEAHVKTRGWIALGLSTNGQMYPADVAVGWVMDDGTSHFSDRHATGHVQPVLDASQDWYLDMAEENEFGTVMKITRRLVSCDRTDDMDIQDGTNRIIFAYGDHDPSGDDIFYHGNTRGTKSLTLLSANVKGQDLGHVKHWEFRNDNVMLPSDTTTYWCRGFNMPPIGKHHMIKYEPVITPGNEMIVHHILLYRCKVDNPEQYNGMSVNCYHRGRTLPGCANIVIAWAIGGEPFYFPEHTGFSFGGPDDSTFFIMETHYDNPQALSDIIDDSGIRITLTTNFRLHEAGLLELGHTVNNHQIIPPGEADFVTHGYCHELCLQTGLQQGNMSEIKVFGGMQHSHLLGVSITTRHIRNGVELKPLFVDPHYDFDFQEQRLLPNEISVKQGDSFHVECHYDSRSRSTVTLGGLSTQEEMCLTFVYYYPKMPLEACTSMSQLDAFNIPNGHLTQYVYGADWSDQSVVDYYKDGLTKSHTYQVCGGDKLKEPAHGPSHVFMPHEPAQQYTAPDPVCT